jgi:hypothetical protein
MNGILGKLFGGGRQAALPPVELSEKQLDLIRRLRTVCDENRRYMQLEIWDPANLAASQVGYSIDKHGNSLITAGEYSWQPQWVAVGNETLMGDPLFLSTDIEMFGFVSHEPAWSAGPDLTCHPDELVESLEGISRAIKEGVTANNEIRDYASYASIMQHIMGDVPTASELDDASASDGYVHILYPLMLLLHGYHQQIAAQVQARKANGEQLSQISQDLGIPLKDTYKLSKPQ